MTIDTNAQNAFDDAITNACRDLREAINSELSQANAARITAENDATQWEARAKKAEAELATTQDAVKWHDECVKTISSIVEINQSADREIAALRAEVETLRAKQESYVYLASPYSHPDQAVMEERFNTVCKIAGKLMNEGIKVFSPIAHTHPIAVQCELPRGWDYWQQYDEVMVGHAAKLVVVKMDGWEKSEGIAGEIEIAKKHGIPVEYIEAPVVAAKNEYLGLCLHDGCRKPAVRKSELGSYCEDHDPAVVAAKADVVAAEPLACRHERLFACASTGVEKSSPGNGTVGITIHCRGCVNIWCVDVVSACPSLWRGDPRWEIATDQPPAAVQPEPRIACPKCGSYHPSYLERGEDRDSEGNKTAEWWTCKGCGHQWSYQQKPQPQPEPPAPPLPYAALDEYAEKWKYLVGSQSLIRSLGELWAAIEHLQSQINQGAKS